MAKLRPRVPRATLRERSIGDARDRHRDAQRSRRAERGAVRRTDGAQGDGTVRRASAGGPDRLARSWRSGALPEHLGAQALSGDALAMLELVLVVSRAQGARDPAFAP